MKGVVFTEFLDFIGKQRGEDFVDDVIADAGVASGGSYTAVGTYDFSELASLLGAYCKLARDTPKAALNGFGKHLAQVFQAKFPDFFKECEDVIDFLRHVEGHIHVEVRKLYPDAELPRFETIEHSNGKLVMDYSSCRPLADLATGLIDGVAAYYRQAVSVVASPVETADGPKIRFTIAVA
jgi:hypothetical protein